MMGEKLDKLSLVLADKVQIGEKKTMASAAANKPITVGTERKDNTVFVDVFEKLTVVLDRSDRSLPSVWELGCRMALEQGLLSKDPSSRAQATLVLSASTHHQKPCASVASRLPARHPGTVCRACLPRGTHRRVGVLPSSHERACSLCQALPVSVRVRARRI